MIHSTSHEPTPKVTSLSPVAFNERSIGADLNSAGNRSELSVRARIPNGRTNEVVTEIERFEGIRAPFRKRVPPGRDNN